MIRFHFRALCGEKEGQVDRDIGYRHSLGMERVKDLDNHKVSRAHSLKLSWDCDPRNRSRSRENQREREREGCTAGWSCWEGAGGELLIIFSQCKSSRWNEMKISANFPVWWKFRNLQDLSIVGFMFIASVGFCACRLDCAILWRRVLGFVDSPLRAYEPTTD